MVLGSAAAFGLVWGLVRGNVAGWSSLEAVGALSAGVLFTLAFIWWERRVSAPMLPMRFFRIRAFSTANAANFCLFGSLYGTLFFLAQFLQIVQGHGPFDAGLRLMPWTATLMVCAPIAGKLVDKLGERRLHDDLSVPRRHTIRPTGGRGKDDVVGPPPRHVSGRPGSIETTS